MSIHYISASFRAKTGNPLRKLVLIKLCDNANDDGYCFPSYKRISDECEISRRSVINHINQLEIDGIIAKSNRFKNGEFTSNEFIINYKRLIELGSESVALPSAGDARGSESVALPSAGDARGSESVALPSAGDARGVVQEMHPESSLLTVSEPSVNRNLINNATSVAKNLEKLILMDFGIVGDLQEDFLKHRKSLKAPITKTVLSGFQREADKAGISINDAVRISIERGWRGFKAEWNENNLRTFSQKPDKLDSTIQAGIDWLKEG